MEVSNSEKRVLDLVDRVTKRTTMESCIASLYELEKYIASGKIEELDVLEQVEIRQGLTECRQYLQKKKEQRDELNKTIIEFREYLSGQLKEEEVEEEE